jgi:hydrogenase maturation protease
MWIGADAMAASPGKTVVIGIGNPDRRDDAAGRLVARRLRDRLDDSTEVLEHDGEMTSLLSILENVTHAVLIDACVSGAPAGTIHLFDAAAGPLPHDTFDMSSHGLGLAEAIELARALGQLPQQTIVYAIEAATVEPGDIISPAILKAVEEAAERITRDWAAVTHKEDLGDA